MKPDKRMITDLTAGFSIAETTLSQLIFQYDSNISKTLNKLYLKEGINFVPTGWVDNYERDFLQPMAFLNAKYQQASELLSKIEKQDPTKYTEQDRDIIDKLKKRMGKIEKLKDKYESSRKEKLIDVNPTMAYLEEQGLVNDEDIYNMIGVTHSRVLSMQGSITEQRVHETSVEEWANQVQGALTAAKESLIHFSDEYKTTHWETILKIESGLGLANNIIFEMANGILTVRTAKGSIGQLIGIMTQVVHILRQTKFAISGKITYDKIAGGKIDEAEDEELVIDSIIQQVSPANAKPTATEAPSSEEKADLMEGLENVIKELDNVINTGEVPPVINYENIKISLIPQVKRRRFISKLYNKMIPVHRSNMKEMIDTLGLQSTEELRKVLKMEAPISDKLISTAINVSEKYQLNPVLFFKEEIEKGKDTVEIEEKDTDKPKEGEKDIKDEPTEEDQDKEPLEEVTDESSDEVAGSVKEDLPPPKPTARNQRAKNIKPPPEDIEGRDEE